MHRRTEMWEHFWPGEWDRILNENFSQVGHYPAKGSSLQHCYLDHPQWCMTRHRHDDIINQADCQEHHSGIVSRYTRVLHEILARPIRVYYVLEDSFFKIKDRSTWRTWIPTKTIYTIMDFLTLQFNIFSAICIKFHLLRQKYVFLCQFICTCAKFLPFGNMT